MERETQTIGSRLTNFAKEAKRRLGLQATTKEVNLYQDQEILRIISERVGPTLEKGLVRLIGKTSEYVGKIKERGIVRDSEFVQQFLEEAKEITITSPDETLDTDLFTGLTSAKIDMHQRMDGVLGFMYGALNVNDKRSVRAITKELKTHLGIEPKRYPFFYSILQRIGIGVEEADRLFSRFSGNWKLREMVRKAIEASSESRTAKLMVESLAALNDITLAFSQATKDINIKIDRRNSEVLHYKGQAVTALRDELASLRQLEETRARVQNSKMNSMKNILNSSPVLASPQLDQRLRESGIRSQIEEKDITDYADGVINRDRASRNADEAITRSLVAKMHLSTSATRSLQLQDAREMLSDDYREALKYIYSIIFYWVQSQALIARVAHDYTHTRNTLARIEILERYSEYARRIAEIPFEHLKDFRSLEPLNPRPEEGKII